MGKVQEKEIRKRRLENQNLDKKIKQEKGNLRSREKVRNHQQRKRKRMVIESPRSLKVKNQRN